MGNLHLVTGHAGTAHVTAADHASLHAALFGEKEYILSRGSKMGYTIISNNRIRIADGDILIQGRHIRLNEGSYVDLAVESGQRGMVRNDLIVVRYSKNSVTGIEDCNLAVIKGTASADTATDPEYTAGNINDNILLAEVPLYRIRIVNLNVEGIDLLCEVLPSVGEQYTEMEGKIVDELQTKTATVTLTANGWADRRQAVKVIGVKKDSIVVVAPAPNSYDAYAEADIRCIAQNASELVFECESVPEADLLVNVACNATFLPGGGSGTGGGVALRIEPEEDDIPKVFFGGALPQTKDDTVMSFCYISKTKDVRGYCKTKAQGGSSLSYPKKNQTVKLYKDEECTEKLNVDFKGWGEQNKFCFKANWIDLTHARNVVSARLWGDVVKSRSNYAKIPELLRSSPNHGAVDGFPVKVYANGVYQGRYTINIPKDAWMANMDDAKDTHCILCGENYVSACFRAEAKIDGSDWSDEVHDAVPDAIKTRWNEAINFVMNSTDDEFVAGIGNYFDVESLIDYYVFGLLVCNLDGFGKNQVYMTYDGLKWYACAYDLDSTWGLWWDGSYFLSPKYERTSYQDFKDGSGNLLYIRLESLFADEIQARYAELRNGALSAENVINRFERFTDIASRELVVEDYAETTGDGQYTGIVLQADKNNIQQIRNYFTQRSAYVDQLLDVADPKYPFTNASRTFTEGATVTVSDGNKISVVSPSDISAANMAVGVYDLSQNSDSITASNTNLYTGTILRFSLKADDVLRFVVESKNVSKVRLMFTKAGAWEGFRPVDGVTPDASGHVETTYTMTQDYDVANFVVQAFSPAECNNYNFELSVKLYVNDVRYI